MPHYVIIDGEDVVSMRAPVARHADARAMQARILGVLMLPPLATLFRIAAGGVIDDARSSDFEQCAPQYTGIRRRAAARRWRVSQLYRAARHSIKIRSRHGMMRAVRFSTTTAVARTGAYARKMADIIHTLKSARLLSWCFLLSLISTAASTKAGARR